MLITGKVKRKENLKYKWSENNHGLGKCIHVWIEKYALDATALQQES